MDIDQNLYEEFKQMIISNDEKDIEFLINILNNQIDLNNQDNFNILFKLRRYLQIYIIQNKYKKENYPHLMHNLRTYSKFYNILINKRWNISMNNVISLLKEE